MHSISAIAAMVEHGLAHAGFPEQPAGLYDPARYILDGGGKRIRPLMTLLGAQLYTDDLTPHLPVALSMEVFHNFTLVHDDIMDDAPVRRGRQTIHERWDITTGILSGDVMLIQSYILLSQAPAHALPALLNMFNSTARAVCEGQQNDMDFEKRQDVTIAEYLRMIADKTSVLLGCCMYCGAISAGASEADAQLLYETGLKLGISFQIQDDILDAYADAAEFGKKRGGDIIRNKKTFLTLAAMQMANEEDSAALHHLFSTATEDEDEKIRAVLACYETYRVRDYAEEVMARYYEEARAALMQVNVSHERKAPMSDMLEMVFKRVK